MLLAADGTPGRLHDPLASLNQVSRTAHGCTGLQGADYPTQDSQRLLRQRAAQHGAGLVQAVSDAHQMGWINGSAYHLESVPPGYKVAKIGRKPNARYEVSHGATCLKCPGFVTAAEAKALAQEHFEQGLASGGKGR